MGDIVLDCWDQPHQSSKQSRFLVLGTTERKKKNSKHAWHVGKSYWRRLVIRHKAMLFAPVSPPSEVVYL